MGKAAVSPPSFRQLPPTAPAVPAPSTASGLTDRQLRIIEVVLVCVVAFGSSLLFSIRRKRLFPARPCKRAIICIKGAPMAFAEIGSFLAFSVYYAKTNRIAPVLLAHLYLD